MTSATPKNTGSVILERSYSATPEELWAFWTTQQGFDAWWGPVGFRVEVQKIEPWLGGTLSYLMLASSRLQIVAMKAMRQPTQSLITGVFTALEPHQKLAIRHRIDFVRGVGPYEHQMTVSFTAEGSRTHVKTEFDPHKTSAMTFMATQGMESQLTKLPAVLQNSRE